MFICLENNIGCIEKGEMMNRETIDKMSFDELIELKIICDKQIQEKALNSLEEILMYYRRSDKGTELHINIENNNEVFKMIEFINVTDNHNEKNVILEILNQMGYDIRSYLAKYHYKVFDEQSNYSKLKDKYYMYEPLKSEDMYSLLLPYEFHGVFEKELHDTMSKHANIRKWLETPLRVIHLR